jgi:hypothetical protein
VGAEWELRTGRNDDPVSGLDSLPDMSVDVILTDPPYSEHTHSKQWRAAKLHAQGMPGVGKSHGQLGFPPMTETEGRWFGEQCDRLVKRWVVIFSDLEWFHSWRDWIPLPLVRACVWDKVDSAPQFTGDRPAAGAEVFLLFHRDGRKRWNGGGRRNVFRHAVNGEKGIKPHPTTKPLALMQELVELFSEPGELVCDPYAGSGTTGVACRMLGRRFLGWESDANMAEIARRRIAGDRAVPVDGQMEMF